MNRENPTEEDICKVADCYIKKFGKTDLREFAVWMVKERYSAFAAHEALWELRYSIALQWIQLTSALVFAILAAFAIITFVAPIWAAIGAAAALGIVIAVQLMTRR